MNRIFLYIAAVAYLHLYASSAYSQDLNLKNNLNSTKTVKAELFVLNRIEEGIKTGDMTKLKEYFSSQPFVSLLNGVNGYYSSNQVYYILQEFFRDFKVVSFNFENKKFESTVVYGSGIYSYERKGKRGTAHLYVTLNKTGKKWSISQISVN